MPLTPETIGEVANHIGVSVHTLRYYEKIGLLRPVVKDGGGRRQYGSTDIERLRFIRRAQRMHFSLKEIRQLIEIDCAPSTEKPLVQKLVQEKLSDIGDSIEDLIQLKSDLSAMLSACLKSTDEEDCPIIEGIKHERDQASRAIL